MFCNFFTLITFSIGLERLEVSFLEFSHPPGPLPDESVSVHLLTYGELEFIGQFVHKALSFDEFFEWPFSVLAPSTSAPRRRHFSSWEPYIADQGRRMV